MEDQDFLVALLLRFLSRMSFNELRLSYALEKSWSYFLEKME
jgi:hypothetical protein